MAVKKAAASAVLLLLSLVVTGAHADHTSVVEKLNDRFMDTYNRQDVEAVSQLFTEDRIIMRTGMDAVHGREGSEAILRDMFQMGVVKMVITCDEVGPSDVTDTLYERTHYTFFDRKGNIVETGKSLTILKKVAGEWFYHILITTSHPAKKSHDVIKEEIDAFRKQYMEEWEEQDAEGLASLYTCDAKFMPSGMDVVHGKEAIAGVLKNMFNMGMARIHLDDEEITPIETTEESLYLRGYYTLFSAEGDVIDHGKHLVVMKKVDGQWKVYVASFNSNTPLPPESHDEL